MKVQETKGRKPRNRYVVVWMDPFQGEKRSKPVNAKTVAALKKRFMVVRVEEVTA